MLLLNGGKNRCEVCKILNFQAQFHKEDRETLHVIILLGSPKASLLPEQEVQRAKHGTDEEEFSG